MASGQAPLVVAAIDAAVQRCVPKDVLLETVIALKVGESYPIEPLTARLTAAGYVRCQQVEGPGQFALRGGILDVFSPAMDSRCAANSGTTQAGRHGGLRCDHPAACA